MKKYSSILINPQEQIKNINFSRFSNQNSPVKRAKRSQNKIDKNYQFKQISLPFINIHVPSYEIVNEARMRKQQKYLSTPTYQDRHLIDFTMRNVKTKNPKISAISSKVDFFNANNQKRLDIKKQKVFQDLGLYKRPKQPMFGSQRKSTSPEIYKLLQKYVEKKEDFQYKEAKYIAIGRQFELDDYQI